MMLEVSRCYYYYYYYELLFIYLFIYLLPFDIHLI